MNALGWTVAASAYLTSAVLLTWLCWLALTGSDGLERPRPSWWNLPLALAFGALWPLTLSWVVGNLLLHVWLDD